MEAQQLVVRVSTISLDHLPTDVLTLFLMPVETLGQAFSYGWRITARCA
jgi:hypothetical protein